MINLVKDMERVLKALKEEELSVHIDPVHPSVLCHSMARPPQLVSTYNLAKPDLAKRSQPPADGAG